MSRKIITKKEKGNLKKIQINQNLAEEILSSKKLSTHVFKFLNENFGIKQESNFCVEGLAVAIPILDFFLKNKNQKKLLTCLEQSMVFEISKNLYCGERRIEKKLNGFNVFSVGINLKRQEIYFSKSFKDFLINKQVDLISINNLHNSIFDLVVLNDYFDFYYDINFFTKALITFEKINNLKNDDCILNQRKLDPPETEKIKDFFKDNKKKYISDSVGKIFQDNKKGFPFIQSYIKRLPQNSSLIFPMFKLFSPITKKTDLEKWKKGTITEKYLILIYGNKNFSRQTINLFKTFFETLNLKDLAIENTIKSFSYDDLFKAAINFNKIFKTKVKPIDYCSPGSFIQNLIDANPEERKYGKVLRRVMQFIPENKIILKDRIKFGDYFVSQILSKSELLGAGHEFQNCLRHDSIYARNLMDENGGSIFFKFNSTNDNFIGEFRFNRRLKKFSLICAYKKQNQTISQRDNNCLMAFIYLNNSHDHVAFMNFYGQLISHHIQNCNQTDLNNFFEKNAIFMGALAIFVLQDFFPAATRTSKMHSLEQLSYLNSFKNLKEIELPVGIKKFGINQEHLDGILNFIIPSLEKNQIPLNSDYSLEHGIQKEIPF